jgi:serine/threonine-protein kinase
LFSQQADGSGLPQRLTTTPFVQLAKGATPDGKYVLTTDQLPTGLDIGLVSLSAPFDAKPLIQSIADQNNPAVSPDGKWIAYDSGESGSIEIYVRPFPNVDAGRWQVSNAGGRQPVWAGDGGELFFIDGAGFLFSVSVQTTPTFAAGGPQKVSETRYVSGGARSYDVSPNGQRFLMLKDATLPDTVNAPARIVIVLNWLEELKRLVPAN